MGEGRCTYRGRWIPRSYLYDYGEEPIFIGRYRRRGLGYAFGGLLVLSLLLSLVYLAAISHPYNSESADSVSLGL